MSRVSAFHRNFTLKGSLHLPNPRAANPDVVIPGYWMKVELTDQCSYSLQYIGHGEISADAHAVSNTKWDKEPTAIRLLFSQPSIWSKYRMIFTPGLWIVMEDIIWDADIGLLLIFKGQYCELKAMIWIVRRVGQNLRHTVHQTLQFSLRLVTQHFATEAW